MPETKTILHKIAEAFEQGAQPYARENARLASLCNDVEPVESPPPRHILVPGVWLDYQADAGVATTVEPAADGVGLRLQVTDMGTSTWYSLSYGLPVETLRTSRYLGQFLCCESQSHARFRVCLRYKMEDGFRDVFARDVVVLTGGMQEDLIFIRLDPALLPQTSAAEVLLFFEGRSFDVTLRTIEALRV